MGLTVTEDTPADMLAGNMELLVQLPPRMDEDYENDDIYEGDEALRQHHRNHHRHHNHHHNSGHHPRRTVNGNARRVTVARSTPMMDLLVQVATSQKLSASSYTLEAIGEHGLVLTHHPNTPIGALDALQVKLLPKQGTFAPSKTRHVNQPFEQTFRLQVHLPRNQLYVSRVSSRMNLGKILDEVCREKNLDRNNYELCHPANIEETLDLSLSLQDYHLQEVTLCPKRRSMGSSLSSQDIMALQRQEERRRQEAKQSVFGFAFKKSKESSLSTDSLGERSVSPARSDGTGRSASPQAPTAPTRPQRKRRPAPKPPMPRAEPEPNPNPNPNPKGGLKETERESENPERMMVISHSRNSSDSSGYHEASVLSDNLDNNIRVPETLPRRTRLQGTTTQESPGRTLAESSQASKSLGNLAAVPAQRATIARGTSNLSLSSAGLRKKKAAPAPPPPRPLSSAISTQGLERIVDSEESLSSISESSGAKASSDIGVASKRKLIVVPPRASFGSEENDGLPKTETRFEEKIDARKSAKNSPDPEASPTEDPSISSPEIPDIEIVPNVEPAREPKRAGEVNPPVPKPRLTVGRSENTVLYASRKTKIVTSTITGDLVQQSTLDCLESSPGLGGEPEKNEDDHAEENSPKYHDSDDETPVPMPRGSNNLENDKNSSIFDHVEAVDRDAMNIPKKPRRKTMEDPEAAEEVVEEWKKVRGSEEERKSNDGKVANSSEHRAEKLPEEIRAPAQTTMLQKKINVGLKIDRGKRRFDHKKSHENRKIAPSAPIRRENGVRSGHQEALTTLAMSPVNDKSRSCAVISTIPKCDHFQSPVAARTMTSDEGVGFSSMTSSRGSSFGAGKSILESSGQWDRESIGTSSMTTDVTNSGSTDDELEIESFEMFEGFRNHPKFSTLMRSRSELNNFEINTFEGNGRHLTSRSEDFTFALNPNLVGNISGISADDSSGKQRKRHFSLQDANTAGINSRKSHGATKIPAFLATTITWEKQELLRAPGAQNTWTVGESGSTDDAVPLSTEPITKAEETTSDLLKKVSDTLSGSLRSPGTGTVAATSSLANEHQPINDAHCVAEAKTRVNEPQQIPEAKENTVNCTAEDPKNNERSSIDPIDTNFLDNRQPLAAIGESTYSTTSDHLENTGQQDPDSSSTTTDWQYLLPEPPTAFRDTNVEENRQIFSSIPSSKDPSISEDIAKSKLGKSVKSKEIETVLTNGSTPAPNIRHENGGARSRTVSGSSSDLGNESTIDRRRLSRLGIKSDSDSRRGSQASSTPTIAPVDNTLSNFVITTYSRPKNVDIFNEIEEKAREPQHQQQSRKNSGQNGSIFESRKSSTASVRKDETVQQKFGTLIVEKSREQEVTPRNNESISSDKNEALELGDRNLYNTVNRSNIKISIATKPRPRGDSISDNQRPKPVVVTIGSDENTSNSRENGHFGDENNSRESILTGGNNKFSQWREHVVNKQETPNPDKQLQSLQVLRSILPQLDSTARISNDSNITEKANSNPSEETRVSPAPIPSTENTSTEPSTQQTLSASSSNEMPTKRYSYAGPPAINLGSWSDRSSTTRIQIKPDSDYKVENSRSSSEAPSSKKENHYTAVSRTAINSTPDKNSQTIDKAEKKEPNELTKNLIVRNTASGFKRPVSMIVESSGTTMTRLKKEFEDVSQRIVANGEKDTQKKFNGGDYAREQIPQSARKEEGNDEVDARPRNFKELKETFAKDQKSNTLSMPKYGTYGRRVDNSGMKSTSLRRDSSLSSNSDHQQVENARVDNKIVANSAQEKKNSVTSLQNNRNGVQDAVRRTSRGVLMPVVKGFKVAVANEDEATANFSQEKRSGYRVAIGDISNGNYIPNQNGLRKTTQVKVTEEFSSNVPKPPPTMPVITGVTLKSTNHANARPKSMPVQLDTRDQLLESIRSFGQNQLRRVPRKNTNMTGGGPAGSRMVRS